MFYNKIMNENKYSGDYLNFNDKWSYPIQWLQESYWARFAYRELLFRASLAKEGLPSRNLYQEQMTANTNRITDAEKRQKFKDMCACLPIGRSFALANAVDNRANQLAGGVDSYECEVNDPYMVIDDETEDLLAAQCSIDYAKSGVKFLSAQFAEDLSWSGMVAVLVKYNPKTDENEVFRVNPKNTWWDTKYSSLGKERFRGFSTMISFSALEKMIEADGDEINPNLTAPDRSIFNSKGDIDKKAKYTDHHIDTVNGLRLYVEDLNKLATTPGLQGADDIDIWGEYSHDLHDCYNLNWYHTFATDPEARTKSGYNGDDVELTVVYDLTRKIEFKIINRRYVISANSKAFRRQIPYEIINPFTQTIKLTSEEYCLGCPLIFQFERRNMDLKPYPQAPVFPLLDEHDELCSQIAKRKHVTNILSPLRIQANAADADSLGDALNIMGIILDDIQGDIGTVSLAYNYEPIDSEINRLEAEIKARLKGYDDFDAMQAMGDRASAAESGMATGAIAQGLTTLQQTVMQLYADIARLCIGNRVTYSDKNNFRVYNGGDYSTLTIQQMASLAIVDVKPKLAKKVQQRALATNALALVANLGQSGFMSQELMSYLVEQALFEQMPRGMASKLLNKPTVSPEAIQANAQQAQNMATALQQNQQMYEQNPGAYELNNVMQSASPEEIDQLISAYSGQMAQESEPMTNQNLAAETSSGIMPTETTATEQGLGVGGLPPELGGEVANAGQMM